MSDTVIVPPTAHHHHQRVFIPPLLIVAWLIYNLLAFTVFGGSEVGWENPLFAVPMVSGVSWGITWGDLMVIIGLVLLFLEILKSTQAGRASVLEHMLSTALLIVFLIEFLLVRAAANSVFFILMAMSLIDVVAGFTVSIRTAGREVTMN